MAKRDRPGGSDGVHPRATGRLGRATAAAALALAAVGAANVAPAYASCAEDSGPAGSPVIFVGSVEDQRRGFTQFSVGEVLTGPDLAPHVWVQSGQEQPPWPASLLLGVGSSGDAELLPGQRYVVGASADFHTNACSVSEFSSSSDSAAVGDRPAPARAPVPSGSAGADPPLGPVGQGLWIAGFLAVLGSATALLRRHRHRQHTEA